MFQGLLCCCDELLSLESEEWEMGKLFALNYNHIAI